MLHPSYTDLINAVNSEVEPGEQPVVQSRYSIVLATSKRARQIIGGMSRSSREQRAKSRFPSQSRSFTRVR
ncbi:MAG: DNA-directed RNA polymerase subunit omega [Clostridium sp.]